jgi:hypothetical protein
LEERPARKISGASVEQCLGAGLSLVPANDAHSLSSALDIEEEGMVPLSSIRREGGQIAGLQHEADADQNPNAETVKKVFFHFCSASSRLT